ncbi:hypothetical protein H920_10217 [Fukomys damarensis]|uniref:Type 2 DNA topoisomerase 6 subunit B-like n=1 Tax=Fukomys damarensis TaxID=885580 RepID=A0A091DZW1_FUKDA|nr:hypothetical protein H920_10217 [Fukomys damarensis]
MERTALAVCEILRYLIIHWRCETETSNGALLEGQLVISIEALNSKHQPNALHCVTTIASVRSICGGLVLKKFLKDLVLPDVSYQVESSERGQSQIMHLQGQTLLLFLFVDFHSGFPVQQMEIWGVHTLLTAHLSAILTESHTVIQDSIHFTLDQILEERDQAAKAHQKLQASLSVAVSSIMSVVTGSTSGSFRKTCLQALQAADTQEFGTKLHKIFCDITQHRFLHHCSSNMKQQLIPEKNNSAQSTEDAHESGSPELLAEISRQAQRKRPKSDSFCHGQEETLAFMTSHRAEPHDASLTPREEEARTVHDRAPAPERASSGSGLEDALWLQEVSNLSEWLSPGSGS